MRRLTNRSSETIRSIVANGMTEFGETFRSMTIAMNNRVPQSTLHRLVTTPTNLTFEEAHTLAEVASTQFGIPRHQMWAMARGATDPSLDCVLELCACEVIDDNLAGVHRLDQLMEQAAARASLCLILKPILPWFLLADEGYFPLFNHRGDEIGPRPEPVARAMRDVNQRRQEQFMFNERLGSVRTLIIPLMMSSLVRMVHRKPPFDQISVDDHNDLVDFLIHDCMIARGVHFPIIDDLPGGSGQRWAHVLRESGSLIYYDNHLLVRHPRHTATRRAIRASGEVTDERLLANAKRFTASALNMISRPTCAEISRRTLESLRICTVSLFMEGLL